MKTAAVLAFLWAAAGAPAAGGSTMEVRSPAFTAGGAIPARFTCDGEDAFPGLSWSGAPAGTRSFAVVVHDPDAPDPARPQRDYVHLVLYGIPAGTTSLAALPAGGQPGKNDFGKTGWGGPCPPTGRHRYFFEVYALDTELPDLKSPTRTQLDAAMKGHVLAKGELMGTYARGG